MSYDPTNRWTANAGADVSQVGVDVGLRNYMLRVYNYMAGGLAITGVTAFLIAMSASSRPWPSCSRSPSVSSA
jgi:uncharacterized protein